MLDIESHVYPLFILLFINNVKMLYAKGPCILLLINITLYSSYITQINSNFHEWNIIFYLCITFIAKAFYPKYINYLYIMYAPHSSLRLFYPKGLKDET
jgi:hypothetical protein